MSEGDGDATTALATARRYLALEPLAAPPAGMTMDGATCGQAKLMAALAPSLGPPIGYKAGLTNTAVQKRFGIDQPLLGVLLERMLLREDAVIPGRFGVRPFLEADLIVEAGSGAVNDATTPAEVLASLRAIRPFIAAALRQRGESLRPGDLLSLGAFSSGPIPAGPSVKVTDQGLPGNPSVEARFP